jgi:hypothetical protein
MKVKVLLIALLTFLSYSRTAFSQRASTTVVNFNKRGEQVMKFTSLGEAIDAHDGEIAYFKGVYYLYGTSYGCGFSWGIKDAPFCGFKTYSSTDMVNWTDRGEMFDASTAVWQSRCNGNTYGCFRPHVIYNKKTSLYVLWINVYDNRIGFRVFTSKSPVGPFKEVAEPKLAVNSDSPIAGLNNGDHDTFVDEDGTGYIAYTDWRTTGTIVIEQLSDNYLTGTGTHVKSVTAGNTEAPTLFKRNNIYYVTYSDPNCGYCSGTGTSYKTAKNPLGPWSKGIKISDNSCGGQPSFVSTIKLASGNIYLYGSDLWNNAAKNESLANFYWAPLSFAEDGSINPMICQEQAVIPLDKKPKAVAAVTVQDLDNTSGTQGFTQFCDIGRNIQRAQSFVASRTGVLSRLSVATFKSGFPDRALVLDIQEADDNDKPVGPKLSTTLVNQDSLKWSANYLTLKLAVPVVAGKRYTFVLSSLTTQGCYGIAYSDDAPYTGGGAAYSADGGSKFKEEKNRSLMFQTIIQKTMSQ